MPLIQAQLSKYILEGAKAAQTAQELPVFDLPVTAPIAPTKRPEWGHYSSNVALQAARPTGMKPMEIAHIITKYLPQSEIASSISVTNPGFINITLATDWLARHVDLILETGERYADLKIGEGLSAQVEFVSANPTGPLSVGRGRGGVIGDTMANLLEAAGYKVTREYYFNNAGNQMRTLGESLRLRYLQVLGEEVDFPEDYYQGEYLTDLANQLKKERGPDLKQAGWETFKEIAEQAMFENIRTTLSLLKIEMDIFFNENSLYESGSVWETLERLRERGYIYEKEGATWFATTRLGGPEDRVVVKSTGEPTYRLPDIAYHANKLERGFDLVIDVLGADHKDSFPDVIRGLEALGFDASGVKILMNQFVTVKGERMSTRAGRFTTLDELIEEVGGDVVRFFMLMRSAESHLEFDLDLAREQSEKNPVYYVQYAHTRICSILRKAEEKGFSAEGGDVSLLTHPAEQALILNLLDLSEIIQRGVSDLAPHHLTTFSRELANAFHAFYRDCTVLDSDNPDMTRARLKLVSASKIGLARTLGLLGVSAPEVM
jgi:arginyl-tRNA synthetase